MKPKKIKNCRFLNFCQKYQTAYDFWRFATKVFARHSLYFGHGTENAGDDAFYLVAGFLKLPFTITDCEFKKRRLSFSETQNLLSLVQKRVKDKIPVAYLLHKAYFANLEFYVDERVLIPRSSIAELILQKFSPWKKETEITKVLDIGTGSGCIGLAIAQYLPHAQVTLTDISDEALKIAQINRQKHNLTNVSLQKSDVFAALNPEEKFDIIISNPPYVPIRQWQTLPKEYHREPSLALTGDQKEIKVDDGLFIVDKILADYKNFLQKDGLLIVEVGQSKDTLIAKYPNLPFIWLNFSFGECEVFLLRS